MKLSSALISTSLQPFATARHIYIAYSGGIDSHVLLHLCAKNPEFSQKLTAVHIHHGLQASADSWAQHCGQTAEQLGVNFVLERVNAQPQVGQSPEEAAREARYRALTALLDDRDLLLTAQHREDQYETILLQMLRGAGLDGLAGMPEQAQLVKGTLLRPLLDVAKQAITDYALDHQLEWVEDSSNQQDDIDRNYLRNHISPLIKARWPSADMTISRSGKHCAEASQCLEEMGDSAFLSVYHPQDQSLCIPELLQFDRYRQCLIIRHWFRAFKLRMPSTRFIQQILTTVIPARDDADPQLRHAGFEVRRYRDYLYLLDQISEIDHSARFNWGAGRTEMHLPDNGTLSVSITHQPGIDAMIWRQAEIYVGYRQGGERIGLPGRIGSHSLKKLFQESGVPPWQRSNLPLVYINGRLAAVADQWISNEFYRQTGGDNIQLQWRSDKPENRKDHDLNVDLG